MFSFKPTGHRKRQFSMQTDFPLVKTSTFVAGLLLVSSLCAGAQNEVTPFTAPQEQRTTASAALIRFRLAKTTREVAVYLSPDKAQTPLYLLSATPVIVAQSISTEGVRWAKIAGEERDYFVNEAALNFSGDVLEAHMQKRTKLLTRGEKFVEAARKFLGTPYVWGGTSSKGIDESGLILKAANAVGYTLPRVSRDQFRVGIPVDIKDLQPGDRLYFSASRVRVDHTGIYAGNGRIIEANGAFRRVIERNLFTSSLFRKMYVGARRGLLEQNPTWVQPTKVEGHEALFYSSFVRQYFVQPLTKPPSR